MSHNRKPWAHPGTESRHKRGYGREHVRLREQLLKREPLCRLCQRKTPPVVTVATIADHVTPLAKGGAAHDIANLQPVCKPCHDRKTAEDNGWRFKRTISPDGWPEE